MNSLKRKLLSLICLLLLISLLSSCSILESLMHTHAYRDEHNDNAHWKVCVDCGEKSAEEAHSFVLSETVEASCDHAGYTLYKCTGCDFTRTDVIPAIAHRFESVPASDKRVCSICGREESALAELPETGRYGYLYLSSLADSQKYLRTYSKISAAIGNAQSNVNIQETLTKEELAAVFHCCTIDHPEYFWIGTEYNYSYTSSGLIKSVQLVNLISASDLEAAKATFVETADAILAGVSSSMSNFEKELYIHDAIVKRASYDQSYAAPLTHSAYGNLVFGTSVCDGYTKLFQYLMTRCGILTTSLAGYAGENHSWNAVYLEGDWYMIDLTWDDPVGQAPGEVSHTYFNCTSEDFARDHLFTTPSGEAVENYFTVPVCNANRYNYFTYNEYEGNLSLDTIEQVVRAQAALGETKAFEIRFYGHGNTAEEKEANISEFINREANRIFSILAKILGKPQSSIHLGSSTSKDGNVLKLSVD